MYKIAESITSCRHFRGDKPCKFKSICPSISNKSCEHWEDRGVRVLIIKLGAFGDVLRTTCILPGIQRRFPVNHITWVTDEGAIPLLEDNPEIHRLYGYNLETAERLSVEKFDWVINLDKDPRATALAMKVECDEISGFGMDSVGNLCHLNEASRYSLRLGFDDDLKFRQSKKTYQELCYEACEMEYQGDGYVFSLRPFLLMNASKLLRDLAGVIGRRDSTLIGLNLGAGVTWPTKSWPEEHWASLIRKLSDTLGLLPVILGGQREEDIAARLSEIGPCINCINPGNDYNMNMKKSSAISKQCAVVVTCDSLGMHMALAMKVPTVVLFGPTCDQEVAIFGKGLKVIGHTACRPCYQSECESRECMTKISPEIVFDSVMMMLR